LPLGISQAVDNCNELLLDDKLEYYFEEYKSEFDFVIDETNDLLKITQIVTCSLVVPLGCNAPTLLQYIEIRDEGGIKADYLRINNEDIDFKKHATVDPMNPRRLELRYDLRPHLAAGSGSRTLKYERKIMYLQSLSKKPYYSMSLMHNTRGLTLETTASEGYYVVPAGLDCSYTEFPATEPDNAISSKKRWQVSDHNQLLLSGYSYIIIILKNPET
jgi:hypothetical protein